MDSQRNEPSFHSYRTPFGRITLQSRGDLITRLVFGASSLPGSEMPNRTMNDAATQINEYLAGKRAVFDVSLDPEGTDFQKSVWSAVSHIPYGQTRTPSEIAELLGMPSSYRAVGAAVARNPIPILIPAHRIAGMNEHVDPQDRGAIMRARFRMLEKSFS